MIGFSSEMWVCIAGVCAEPNICLPLVVQNINLYLLPVLQQGTEKMNADDGQEHVGTPMGQLSDSLGRILMDLVRGLVILSFVKVVLNLGHCSSSKGSAWSGIPRRVVGLIGPFLLLTIARVWLSVVTVFVPDPYLVSARQVTSIWWRCVSREGQRR